MALFGSKKQAQLSEKKVRPTVVRTQNVAKELIKLAKANKVDVSTLDFNILEVETYTRISKDNGDVDWEEVDPDRLDEIDDATAILNPRFEIKQMYEIEVFSKDAHDSMFKNFKAAVGANATKCKVYLSIQAGSKISSSEKFEENFLEYINKSKIRAGILISIFDNMLTEFVSRAYANVKVDGELLYKNKETVLIANAYEPTPTIDDELILHFDKDKQEISENERIDYSNRGFIKAVKKGDVLIEYIKPKKGKAGRNCRGEFMEPKEPVIQNEPDFTVDDTIEIVDNKDNIEYIAKESGYIALDGNMYQIKSDMDVDSVDFKTTGSITAGVDSDVVLTVKESNPEKDAIGSGMEVAVKEIDIEGNVGSHAIVQAKRISIDGQTHQSSEVKAEDLTIHVHKGLAAGRNISITRLESGVVRGRKVDVSQAIGGDISAREIEIGVCVSHVKAKASVLIEIKKLQGSENVFIIDPLVQEEKKEGLDETQDEIKALDMAIREIRKEIDNYTILVKNNLTAYNDIKRRLMSYKKNGIKMPSSFVSKYKQFKKIEDHLISIKKECKLKEDKLQLLTTKTVSFQDNIMDARIINRDRWVGHNEIVFRLVEPPIELRYSPPEGSPDLIFGLVEVEDGEFKIEAMSE
jgi:hypothetical protein